MKLLEASRREVLRDFMIAATAAIQDSWSKLPALCGVPSATAMEVDAAAEEVERDVTARALVASEEKVCWSAFEIRPHGFVLRLVCIHSFRFRPNPSRQSSVYVFKFVCLGLKSPSV